MTSPTALPVLQAPFPWFGGKSRAAALVWDALGSVTNYVEPFFGSGAILLGRPSALRGGQETVNDRDGFVCNVWRAIQRDPDEVARWAEWPANECDLHARHLWLVERRAELTARLEGDPDYCDVQVAGWWLWGIASWIGREWCSGKGPWRRDAEGRLVKSEDTEGQGVRRQTVELDHSVGVRRSRMHLVEWMRALQARLRLVRVACGDWMRVMTDTPLHLTRSHRGVTGVVLDPPYGEAAGRDSAIYSVEDLTVAAAAREWALANGDNSRLRIVLCGYEGEHSMPPGWRAVAWKAHGGYASQGAGRGRDNRHRERLWLSPHCLRQGQMSWELEGP